MSWNNKVVWTEGMFLRPQHFQQQERYIETLVKARSDHLRPYDWGVVELELDQDALNLGKLAVARCVAILPDGTPISIPDDDEPPIPLEIDDDLRDTEIMLAMSIRRPGAADADRETGLESVARHRTVEYEIRDNNAGFDSAVQIEIGRRRLRLLPRRGDLREYSGISVGRVVEKRSDQTVVLDRQFIPPCLDCRASPLLSGFLNELHGLLHQRGEALAGRVTASGRGGVAEIADFLLLQTVNRFEPLFAHLASMSDLHPEGLFRNGLQLAGEMATFTNRSKRPASFPVYDHDDLKNTFQSLMQELRQSLSMVLEQNAIQLPLQERKYGIHVSAITDRSLLSGAIFILAVRADIPVENLLKQFPRQLKIGPVEHIRQLVTAALPGIELRPLPVAPRQIPYHAGTTYFELAKSGEHWKQMANSGGFAFHVSGNFPGLDMAFWAIKG
ncbi:MAG: type VI secretion system baseplate subunit TssK [Gammaproteobacteria bacterium]